MPGSSWAIKWSFLTISAVSFNRCELTKTSDVKFPSKNSEKYPISFWASAACSRGVFTPSNCSPKCTTRAATALIRSSKSWNDWNAACCDRCSSWIRSACFLPSLRKSDSNRCDFFWSFVSRIRSSKLIFYNKKKSKVYYL